MRNILNLLQKYSSVILFLLLQVVCFSFIFSNYNNYHHIAFSNSSNSVIGGIYNVSSNISNYFHLTEANKFLVEENNELKKKLIGHNIKVGDLFTKVNDTIFLQQYDFIDAKVINNTKSHRKNSMTLNRGITSGANSQMGVYGTKGVVGITVSSSSYYTAVIPIINELFEMSVLHDNSKSYGLLKWTEENDWQTATVVDIPIYIEVEKGDSIVSRGSDGFFPEGILVGTVIGSNIIKGTSYQKLVIQLAEDFSSIYDVTIVKNILQKEQQQIESQEE